ncbi:MAG: FAD-dependent oxidoreductase, partial [Myxococcota bacterium]|nr:FAD-dependent oxidoreductase [Myxococcota bacterium]
LDQHVQRSWGAVMLYLTADELSSGGAEHWQMVNDANLPFHSGNHVFCSIGGSDEIDRAPHGQRTLTLSSHFPIDSSEEQSLHAARVQTAQEKMSETFALRCPGWAQQIRQKMTASPRTFERFTGRPEGRVGGPPRLAGWGQYLRLSPTEIQPRLYLVGDSVFPGQSTLACALSGHRAVESASRRYF